MLIGAGMVWLPLHTQLALDDWKVRLRAEGEPVQAVVYDRVTKGHRNRKRTTMYLRYEFDGGTHRQEVGCWEACLPVGSTVPIWVNRRDPSDFVTDVGVLSGHRGRAQGLIGAAGAVVFVVGPLSIPFAESKRARRGRRGRRGRAPVPGGGQRRTAGASAIRSRYKRGGRRR